MRTKLDNPKPFIDIVKGWFVEYNEHNTISLTTYPEHECSSDFLVNVLPDTSLDYDGFMFVACDYCYYQVVLAAAMLVTEDGHDGFSVTRTQNE